MRADRPRRRIFRKAQAVSQRGLLYRLDLSIDGLPHDHVPGAFRDSADVRVGGAVGRDAAGFGAEDCAAAASLPGLRHTALPAYRSAGIVPATTGQPG